MSGDKAMPLNIELKPLPPGWKASGGTGGISATDCRECRYEARPDQAALETDENQMRDEDGDGR